MNKKLNTWWVYNVLAYDSFDPKVKIEGKSRKEKVSHEIKIESVGKSS